MAHPLFGPEVRLLLEEKDSPGIKAFCESLHPATVAEALEGNLAVEETWRFLEQTNIRTQAAIFEYFPMDWQIQMVDGTGRQRMAKLIEQMSHDDRADLLRRLQPAVAEGLLRLVDEAERRDIASIVKFPENSAGALMTTDYAWLPENISVGEAIDRLRLQAPNSEMIYYVYILNEERKLLGVITLRDLIMAPRYRLIRDIMSREVVSVQGNEDREEVAQKSARYDLLALPVLDAEGRLVGIVTHDDVIDVVVQEATEDVHRMGGVGVMVENYLQARFMTVWRKRVGWLSLLFVTALFTIFALKSFQAAMEHAIELSLFIALCIGTGGNSGSQAATLITRALALGQLTVTDWSRVVRHELMMGLALGISLGMVGFLVVWALSPWVITSESKVEWWQLALIVAQAVAAICLWGTLVGSMLPLVFRSLGFDPALASSPFVAMFVDVTGIVIYFTIARLMIPDLAL